MTAAERMQAPNLCKNKFVVHLFSRMSRSLVRTIWTVSYVAEMPNKRTVRAAISVIITSYPHLLKSNSDVLLPNAFKVHRNAAFYQYINCIPTAQKNIDQCHANCSGNKTSDIYHSCPCDPGQTLPASMHRFITN